MLKNSPLRVWRHGTENTKNDFRKLKGLIFMQLYFKFRPITTINGWDMRFWSLKISFFRGNLDPFRGPVEEIWWHLSKAHGMNCMRFKGKETASNCSNIRAPRVVRPNRNVFGRNRVPLAAKRIRLVKIKNRPRCMFVPIFSQIGQEMRLWEPEEDLLDPRRQSSSWWKVVLWVCRFLRAN